MPSSSSFSNDLPSPTDLIWRDLDREGLLRKDFAVNLRPTHVRIVRQNEAADLQVVVDPLRRSGYEAELRQTRAAEATMTTPFVSVHF